MKTTHFLLLLALTVAPSAWAADADDVLRDMSAKLAASKRFTFTATRQLDPALREQSGLPGSARVNVAVERPNRIAARSVSREGTRHFIADGRRVTVIDETAGFHAQVPMRGSLDQLVAALDEVYGFVPPLAEFALSDVYRDLRRQAQSVRDLGTAKVGGFLGIGGVECHRIGLSGKAADAELWIAKGDSLPRQLVATFKREGQPQLRVTFTAWNLAAPVSGADFAAKLPAGSKPIEMWTRSRMSTAATAR